MDKNEEAMKLVDEAVEVIEDGVAEVLELNSTPERDYSGGKKLKTELVAEMNEKAKVSIQEAIAGLDKEISGLQDKIERSTGFRTDALSAIGAIDASLTHLGKIDEVKSE